MNLSSLFNPDLVLCDLQGTNKQEVYTELISCLNDQLETPLDPAEIYDQIIDHENLIDMPYQVGFAVPHTRSSLIDDFYIIVGIHKEGVLLQEQDLTPSKVIIMCLISKETSDLYLLTLRSLCNYFSQPGISDKIAQCKNADEFLSILEEDHVEISHTLTAEDVMETEFCSLTEGASLKEALDLFTRNRVAEIPIINSTQELIGEISPKSVLKAGVPDYMLMMDNYAFLNSFEPFTDLLTQEDTHSLKEIINLKVMTCSKDTPIAQLVLGFVKNDFSTYYVLDENKKLIGTVSQLELVVQTLRG